MGDCKDNVTQPKTEKGKTLLEKAAAKLRGETTTTTETSEKKCERLVDHLADSEEILKKLIQSKEKDLTSEAGKEEYNRKALTLLRLMDYHLDEIVRAMVQYKELK